MNAAYANWRWMSACKPGMYLANISGTLPGHEHGRWHLHAHCVVDDFGDLQPISFDGLDARGRSFDTERGACEPLIRAISKAVGGGV